SDPRPVYAEAALYGLANAIDVRRLDGEKARRLVHAASDLSWIPRRSQGGLPIKMLDAFARGLPVVAMARATADLPVDGACVQVPNDDGRALADAARLLFDGQRTDALCEAGRRYLVERHSGAAFDAALAELLGQTPASAFEVPSPERNVAQHPRALSTYASTRLFLDPE
ncbi:MAG: glycosyltransferase, partial [Polyangiales bacterium]